MSNAAGLLKIGELANRAGLTVRTLHHYDAIGLLSPSIRTSSGSRRYGKTDLIRLHRVQALKQLGYSLAAIRAALDDAHLDPLALIQRQIHDLGVEERQAQQLSQRLQELARQIASGEAATSEWLDVLEMMGIYQKHLTDNELRTLHNPKDSLRHEIEAQWSDLIDRVEAAVQQGIPTSSLAAQALAWRWVRLVIAMTSNDPRLAAKLMTIQLTEERARDLLRIDVEKIRWIGEAFAHARTALFAKHLTASETDEVRRRQLANQSYMADWPLLVAQVRERLDEGEPPESDVVQQLALRWQQLFLDSYCGADAALEARVREAFRHEPDLRIGVGIDAELTSYIQRASSYALQRTAGERRE
jgi:DNA-binding transcriptional MerR regulator